MSNLSSIRKDCEQHAEAKKLPPFSPRALLHLLWGHAAEHLTSVELAWIADSAPEFVESHAYDLGVVMDGIGCLVASDSTGACAGSFQGSEDVPTLMFALSSNVQLLGALASLGGLASEKQKRL